MLVLSLQVEQFFLSRWLAITTLRLTAMVVKFGGFRLHVGRVATESVV